MVLSQEHGIEIVGEAGDGAEAIRRAEELLPDVVLMDVRMPRRSGIEACTAIKDARAVDQDRHADHLRRGVRPLRGGPGRRQRLPAQGRARARRSPTASGRSHGGQSLISPSMACKLLTEFAAMIKRAEERQQVPVPRLTDRELEVLRLVARGMANRTSPSELFISENTVKNHVRNILEKLQLHSRMEAAMYAVRENILDLRE